MALLLGLGHCAVVDVAASAVGAGIDDADSAISGTIEVVTSGANGRATDDE